MRKNIVFLFTAIVLCAGAMCFAVFYGHSIPQNIFSFLDIGTYRMPPDAVEINSSSVYGQIFTPNFDYLFMISFFVPAQNLNSDQKLVFHLTQAVDSAKDIATISWNYSELKFKKNNFYIVPPDRESGKDGFHFHVQFSPIKESKNKKFYFYLESPGAQKGEGLKVGIWKNISYYEALTDGGLVLNHLKAEGYMAFRTYNTIIWNFRALIRVIGARFSRDTPFMLFYVSTLCALLFSMAIITKKRPSVGRGMHG